MAKRKAFLQSVCKESVDTFMTFIKNHRDSAEPFDLEEVLQELPQSQREVLWDRLMVLLAETLVAYPIERWDRGLNDDSDDEMEVEVSAELKLSMSVIGGVTVVATASVPVIQQGESYGTLLQCVHVLHDILAALPPSEAPLQMAIQQLCEAWWQAGLEGKDPLGRTAFLCCLERSLLLKKPGPEMHRLLKLREVMHDVSFESEDSKEVTDLLLQCFLSFQHVRSDEGRRFLTFLFGWNVNFIRMIHETIKNQLQFFPKSRVNHIADIYFRAWKAASGIFLEELETTCIQDFMQHAILLQRHSPVYAKVRQVISYFHKQKLRQGVDEMLHRLYKPILWRGLKAANPEVRANAAVLFTEAFPVQEPSLGSKKEDEALQKQLHMLFALLEDPSPMVLSATVLGVCKILAKYWEVIPPPIIADLLKKLISQLAAHTNSADVRCSVCKCLPFILDNNLSHPLLEQLLPALRNSLHDNSEKVRVAFVDLLLKVKAARAAKFWKVCSMEHLLARLEVDTPPVTRRIVSLLFNSFFPTGQSEEVWCERCVTLVQMNPAAARTFYRHLHEHTAPTNIAKLMLTIRQCLNSCVRRSREEDPSETNGSNKENSSVLDSTVSSCDAGTVASLLEVVVILWRSIADSLVLNEDALRYTSRKFARVLPEYFRVFQDERCTVPLILIASFMPAADVPTFSCSVLSRLRRMERGAKTSQYSALIDCICRWLQAGHVLELIADWLTEALPQKTGKRRSERRVCIQETVEAKPDLALDYLEYMMSCKSRQTFLLDIKQKQLNNLLKVLWSWKSVLYEAIASANTGPSEAQVDTALRAVRAHGWLSALLHTQFPKDRAYLQGLEHTAAWVAERALPFLLAPSSQQQVLAKRVVQTCLTVFRDVTMVGLGDGEFNGQVLNVCSAILMSEGGPSLVPLLLSVLKEVALESLAQYSTAHSNQLDLLLVFVTNVFQKVLEVMARKLCKQPDEGLQLCQDAMTSLREFLHVVQEWKPVKTEVICGLFSTLFAAIVVETRHTLLKATTADDVVAPETTQDLPPLSGTLLTVILKSPRITRSFLGEIDASLESEAIEDVTGLAAVMSILAVLRHSGTFKSELKGIAVTVEQKLQKHCTVTAQDTGTMDRVIYESAVKSLNSILML